MRFVIIYQQKIRYILTSADESACCEEEILMQNKSKLTALLLCIFFGGIGIHRFYTGKIGTGILWLLTGGCFGIGYVVDIIMIATGKFMDKDDRPLV